MPSREDANGVEEEVIPTRRRPGATSVKFERPACKLQDELLGRIETPQFRHVGNGKLRDQDWCPKAGSVCNFADEGVAVEQQELVRGPRPAHFQDPAHDPIIVCFADCYPQAYIIGSSHEVCPYNANYACHGHTELAEKVVPHAPGHKTGNDGLLQPPARVDHSEDDVRVAEPTRLTASPKLRIKRACIRSGQGDTRGEGEVVICSSGAYV